MESEETRNVIVGSQGWQEFLGEKELLLAEYQLARRRSRNRPTPGTEPGEVAEAVFRRWLTRFLPERYGVTSGFVISAGLSSKRPLRHYDVIIYDRANSPVLWRSEQPDRSVQGTSIAIPVEHVRAVFEVKSTLDRRSVRDAAEKLDELSPLLSGTDEKNALYPIYLPEGFVCGAIFFRVDPATKGLHLTPLAELASRLKRGLWGGLALSLEADPSDDEAGRIRLLVSAGHPLEPDTDPRQENRLSNKSFASSGDVLIEDRTLNSAMTWSINEFGYFAHDLVAILADRFRIGYLSSMHGVTYALPEGSAGPEFVLDALDEEACKARKARGKAAKGKAAGDEEASQLG